MEREERRRWTRSSPIDAWLGDLGGSAWRKVAAPLRDAGRRAWRAAVGALMTLALLATAAVFLLIGGARLLQELKLPAWLAYGLWGGAGLLAGALLWRAAFAERA